MIEFGKSIDCKYMGYYSVVVVEQGEKFTFPHYCYSMEVSGSEYYLNIPKHGHICFIENISPDLMPSHETREDLRVKFIGGGGMPAGNQEYFKLTDNGKYNAVVQQYENAKVNGPYFRRVQKHFWNGSSYGRGMVVDVRVPPGYIDEGYITLLVDGQFRRYNLALNIHGSNASRVCNKSKYGFFILTVPFDILTFPWAIKNEIQMIDH